MGVIPLYIPDRHDILLFQHHKNGLSDPEIGDLMGFSSQEIGKQRKRLKLATNRPPKRPPPKHRDTEREGRNKPDPLAVAQKWVPGFNRLKMTLHGHPVKLRDIMRLTNRALSAAAIEQIGPHHWRVP